MSKAIIRIDIPTDYADEYKQWIIEGRLCYLEDNAWTYLKDVECKVEPYREAIPIEWLKSKIDAILDNYPDGNEETEILCKLLYEWEKENEHKESD